MARKREFKSLPGVYKIVVLKGSLVGRAYIGSAKNVSNRLSKHIEEMRCNKHHNSKLQNVFTKYGLEAFEFHLVEYVPADMPVPELRILEKSYMDEHVMMFGRDCLLNETMSTENSMDDPEVVARCRAIMEKMWEDPVYRKAHSERRTAANNDPTFKEKMREVAKNLHKDPIYKAAITRGIKNKWANDLEWRAKMVDMAKSMGQERVHEIYCYETSKIFKRIGEVVEWLKSIGFSKASRGGVWKSCKRGGSTAGYHFDYIENVTESKKVRVAEKRKLYPSGNISYLAKPVYCYELDKSFGSISQCSKYLHTSGITNSLNSWDGLMKCLNDNTRIFHGMHWCFLSDVTESNKLKYANKSFPSKDNPQ